MAKEINNLEIRNARLVFRNFSGNPDRFHPEPGNRTFSVVIDDPDLASSLKKEGWNVRQFNPRPDDEGEPDHFITVKVKYSERSQPHIYLCTSKKKTLLTKDTVNQLDYAEIAKADLVVRPWEYEPGKISAYVKTLYVTVVEDEFADDYNFEEDEVPFN